MSEGRLRPNGGGPHCCVPGLVSLVRCPGLGAVGPAAPDAENNASGTAHRTALSRLREVRRKEWRERRLGAVAGTPRDVVPGAAQGGKRGAGAGGGLVRIVGGMAGGLGGRGLVAGVMPGVTGSRGAGQIGRASCRERV